MRAFLLLALLVSPPSAAAQDGPLGIGFAQAEEGTWFCRSGDFSEALSCARELCLEQAIGQECVPTAWCLPARWSGQMMLQLEGFHTTHVLCGAPSEAALSAAMAVLCADNESATSCELVRTIDPDGSEQIVEGVTFPGGALPLPDDDEPASDAPPAEDSEPETDGALEPAASDP